MTNKKNEVLIGAESDFESALREFLGKDTADSPIAPLTEENDAPQIAEGFRSGLVAFIGRPNAGKSTLLNRLAGEKIAAVSNKPQTTRQQIRGIMTRAEGQIVFVDTPGVHKPGYLLNRRMMAQVHDALASVQTVVLLRDASVSSGNGDKFVLELVKQAQKPTILLLNKADKIKDKNELLPLIEEYSREYDFQAILPVSALKGEAVEVFLNEVFKSLPEGEPIFSADELTDQPTRHIVAEMVREKVLRSTGEEIPYVTAVVTERFDETEENLTRIYCAIYVERDSQKAIVIGKGGARLKKIGTEARADIEKLLGKRVFLQLFVKVEQDWRNKENVLREIGLPK